jgi:DNA-binding LacI/PurR family transcriptional regulator
MAAGAMGVLNDNGIDVPREISLIGFDDVLTGSANVTSRSLHGRPLSSSAA